MLCIVQDIVKRAIKVVVIAAAVSITTGYCYNYHHFPVSLPSITLESIRSVPACESR